MSFSSQQPGRSQARGLQSRLTVRLHDLALQERDSLFYAPRGADWLWLALFAAVMLGSGFYVWQELGFDSELGRAAFFAAALLSLFWAALIYTFKLSASVAVGKRGIALTRGPWRSELIWAEVARLQDEREAVDRQRLRWLVVAAHDGRELRIREDMVADFVRLRAEIYERLRLWEEHGATWGASGGGPFSAEEQVANQVTWWLVAAGALLLPGIYFTALLPDVFQMGLLLVALAIGAAVMALRVALSRQTYVVDQRAVTAHRKIGRRVLSWSQITKVERVRSRVRLLALVGIRLARLLLAAGSRADSRIATFPWSPRVPEYLVLRAEGGRRLRIRLHRLAAPDELLAWIQFYDEVARHHATATQGGATSQTAETTPAAQPAAEIAAPGGEPEASAETSVPSAVSGPRVTQPALGDSGVRSLENLSQVDPRILAVMRDVGDAGDAGDLETTTPSTGESSLQRSEESSWLNESADESLLQFGKTPRAPRPNGRDRDVSGDPSRDT